MIDTVPKSNMMPTPSPPPNHAVSVLGVSHVVSKSSGRFIRGRLSESVFRPFVVDRLCGSDILLARDMGLSTPRENKVCK
jgi:hypothetical protein